MLDLGVGDLLDRDLERFLVDDSSHRSLLRAALGRRLDSTRPDA
jgi:hypothetical protein